MLLNTLQMHSHCGPAIRTKAFYPSFPKHTAPFSKASLNSAMLGRGGVKKNSQGRVLLDWLGRKLLPA